MNVVEVLFDACQLNAIDVGLANLFVVVLGNYSRVDTLVWLLRVYVGSIRTDHTSIASDDTRVCVSSAVWDRC